MARKSETGRSQGRRGQAGEPRDTRPKKRAICLGGGGPAAGLHIGVLERLKQGIPEIGVNEINFDVWAMSCIGAWVGVIYNQARGDQVQETYNFFHDVFRDDKSFKSFPMNTIFTPDLAGNAEAMKDFLFDLDNYKNAFLPKKMMESLIHTFSLLSRRRRRDWKCNEGNFNQWVLNDVLAVNPAMRFLMGMMHKSEIDGLFKLHYPGSDFLKKIKFDRLNEPNKPYIFYNAFNFARDDIDLFANDSPPGRRKPDHKAISPASLCACSALPYVEQTVEIDGTRYCEGALVDTVNFKTLLEDHHRPPNDPLDEIWISRIVDAKQIRKPKNLHDAFANLCQLFAATIGEDDVRLFEYHVREDAARPNAFNGTIVEIHVDSQINFEWSHENLNVGRRQGYLAADEACRRYVAQRNQPLEPALIRDTSGRGVRIIRP